MEAGAEGASGVGGTSGDDAGGGAGVSSGETDAEAPACCV